MKINRQCSVIELCETCSSRTIATNKYTTAMTVAYIKISAKMVAYKWAKLVKHNLDINIPDCTRMHQQTSKTKPNHRCPRRKSKSASQDLKTWKRNSCKKKIDKHEMQAFYNDSNRAQVKAKQVQVSTSASHN
jgi:hypothetical protein